MLIEFSVSNFRSFRDRQTLSMVASPRLHRKENTFKPELTGEKFPALLRACVIYGPNASGKSNLLKALDVIGTLARRQPSSFVRPLPVAPFRFDPTLADKPSLFDVHFVQGGLRYQFEVAATVERIVLERLRVFPKGKETVLYERQYKKGEDDSYVIDPQLDGGTDLHETWKKLTSPTMLFLAQAAINSKESLRQLRAPFEWLKGSVRTVLDGMKDLAQVSQEIASEDDDFAALIASFLRDVDVPVSRVTAKVQPAATPAGRGALESLMSIGAPREYLTTLTHQTALGEADIGYEDESEGTKNLIGFWLPWVTREPREQDARCVLVIDELDGSLHPKIVAALVAKHMQSSVPSQLIFSTHDTHLMDANLLRRDQIWIVERDENGASQLRSVHDFVGRESEDVEKRYYEGRYRGLPLLKGA